LGISVRSSGQQPDRPVQIAAGGPEFFGLAARTGERVDAGDAPVLRQRISLDLSGVAIADALDTIARQALVRFTYQPGVLPAGARVTLRAQSITLAAALTEVLLDAHVDIQVSASGHLTLVSHGSVEPAKNRQQGARVTGRVVDADTHIGIPSAAVLVSGTTIGTNTTDSGTFVVSLPSDAKMLSVRRIGYLAQTVPLTAGKTDYTIALQKDVLLLEQQVVTGVATTVSSQNAANAVSVVNAQQVNQVPAPTVENSLQGKIPGAEISQINGGAPGGGMQIQIRGVTSINASASPLYVVDGVMVNNETISSGLNGITNVGGSYSGGLSLGPSVQDLSSNRIADLNPDDIESIEVLKGASASAIYGSKASSGVVIITTKRGTAGKPKWEISTKVGHFSDANTLPVRTFPTLASAQAWGSQTGVSQSTIDASYAGPQNYQQQLFSNPQASYEGDVSVSGTANQTQYFFSVLSKYDNGTLLNTGYNKQSARVNATQQFADALSATLNMSYAHSLTRRGLTSNDNTGASPYGFLSYTPQFVDLQHQTANGAWRINPFGQANPFADQAEIQTPEEISRFIGGGNIDWSVFTAEHQSLKIKVTGGADLTSQIDNNYAPPNLQFQAQDANGLPGTATFQSDQTNFFNYSINVIHTYTVPSLIEATTSLGFVHEIRTNSAPDIVAQNLLAGVNAPTAGTVTTVFYNRDEAKDQSLYAQEQLILLDSRLTVTGGVTAERTTNDGDINKFYFYPRYSASYRLPQFASFIDEFKLRAAYGQSGTQPNYGVKYTPFNTELDGGANGIAPNLLVGNPSIRPEAETEIETGIDVTMLHSRAQFSATIYQKRVQDLLLQASVAPSLSYNEAWFNGGEFTNQGIELSLTATPVQLKNGFSWIATTTFYRNYSVVNSIPVPAFVTGYSFGSDFGNAFIQPGRSVSELVNTSVLGANGVPVQLGDFQPSYVMSFGQDLTFKAFRLHGLLDWKRGSTTINITNFLFDFGPDLLQNTAAEQARAAAFNSGDYQPYLEPGSYLKLRELTLSYSLPSAVFSRLPWGGRFTSARLSLTGRNLLAWFRYSGLDPEVSVFGSQNITGNQDVWPYPPSRSFFLSLDLGL
jgi:TonB-linked SusC/RagA family outer membrane protein